MLWIVIFYFITHLWNLQLFPVFADEAIYIRWAQLIIDDWQRYAFFPLTDGKTPLFIWSLIPFQFLFKDQLFAARILSVLMGLGQLFVIKHLIKLLGGREKTQWLGMFLVSILPFWFFHHRMALMDGMLTLAISLTVYCLLRLTQTLEKKTLDKVRVAQWVVFSGIMWGISLWIKLPALFLLSTFPLYAFLNKPVDIKKLVRFGSIFGVVAFLGLSLFACMRISPAFGQLFSRGNDYTYPVTEVLLKGKWLQTVPNFPVYLYYYLLYFTVPALLLAVAGLFSNRYRRTTLFLLLSAFLFCLPLMLFGRVIYARYLLPGALFLTIATVLSLQAMYSRWYVQKKTSFIFKSATSLVLALAIVNMFSASFFFMGKLLTDFNTTPFTNSDQSQYLQEWSSGHGIVETVEYIREQSKSHKIAVATEGRFGTLPDALLLYFHRRDVNNIYIEGTGQYPVKSIPEEFAARAKNYDQVILVVNSNRMEIKREPGQLIHEYCRPYNAPCLQIWDVTDLVK